MKRLWQLLLWLWRQLVQRRKLRLHKALSSLGKRGRSRVRANSRHGALRRRPPTTGTAGTTPSAAGGGAGDAFAAVASTLNREASGQDLLQRELATLDPTEAERLRQLVKALTRHWTRPVSDQRLLRRRRRLDVPRTMRLNIPRYGGRIIEFAFREQKVWLPLKRQPARLLLIGDVSYSMRGYVGVALYFFACLRQHFDVDAWIFSSGVTHATPFLDPTMPFAEQMLRLATAAGSWGQGTRLGLALETIAAAAVVTPETYVVLLTDGEIMLHEGELDRINRWMCWLADSAASLTILTPSQALAARGREYTALLDQVHQIPVHQVYEWNPQWQLQAARFGTVARHASDIALAATVGDLCRYCERVAAATGLLPGLEGDIELAVELPELGRLRHM